MSDARLERLYALGRAAERIADPNDALGRRARQSLIETTGLGAAGVELGLTQYLEHHLGRAALSQLVRRAPPASRCHVLLSANVFVAAFRAIALGLSQSAQLSVRASRRAPTLAELLHEGSGGAFDLVDTLAPRPGEHLWAYGSAETLTLLRQSLPAGVLLHTHGPGMGVAVVSERGFGRGMGVAEAARALADDTIAFDQRGCLSPRLVLLEGDASFRENFADALANALDQAELEVPRGELNEAERADALRYERTMLYVGGAQRAGQGLVTLDPLAERLFVPPVGRYLGLVATRDPLARLAQLGDRITTVGVLGDDALPGRVQQCVGQRRVVPLGKMQRPPFDGPVDLRSGWDFEQI